MDYFGVLVAHAQSSAATSSASCTVNGQPVPCDQLIGHFAWFAGLDIGILVLIVAVSILAFIFWLLMLIHAIRNPIHDKALWVIIILLFGVIGAIVYYFAVKRHLNDATPASPSQSVNSTAAKQ